LLDRLTFSTLVNKPMDRGVHTEGNGMAISVVAARRLPLGPRAESRVSIREVCLLGCEPGAEPAAPGERLEWAGRPYVIAGRDRPNQAVAYLHLSAPG
jgi:hypothetical protein